MAARRVTLKSAAVLSSVPLQILFSFNAFYYTFYFLATFLMIIYKSQVYSFPDGNLALDLVLLMLMAVVEMMRLYLGVKGNLTENEISMGSSLGLTVGSVLLCLYFLLWQTYVLKADTIIGAVLLLLYAFEGVLDIVVIADFVRR
ncbi:transmembrane protein 80 isoform X2 [Callorhinchus milii]|uniref:Transmembrane protein 80 n=3 Tax=Callorhinchus milii TaxID=7868 RepID=A0A4W3IFT8_CALMI|nr:transmembrane protein 80 isoform X2 [Callorhinchus milii]|eukprot:gi/632940972/ref/XP_007885619.1/ PREDICTED: transmembrane protein 80 isoform X2 [Callorhinchus milii]